MPMILTAVPFGVLATTARSLDICHTSFAHAAAKSDQDAFQQVRRDDRDRGDHEHGRLTAARHSAGTGCGESTFHPLCTTIAASTVLGTNLITPGASTANANIQTPMGTRDNATLGAPTTVF